MMKKSLGILFLVVGICACGHDTNSYPLGKYVFEDDTHVLHVDEECRMLKSGKDRKGHSIYAKAPIDTAQILEVDRVCSECTNNSTFERLRKICLRNKEIDYDRRWLYDKLNRFGYDMEEYDLFVYHLADDDKRHGLYVTAQKEGLNVGTYDEFSRLLGFGSTLENQ